MSVVRVEILVAQNLQWFYRIWRGSRIIAGPEETYARRANVRRAVQSLHEISRSGNELYPTQLEVACLDALTRDTLNWNNRKINGYGSKPSRIKSRLTNR